MHIVEHSVLQLVRGEYAAIKRYSEMGAGTVCGVAQGE